VALIQNCSHLEHNCVPSRMLGALSMTEGMSVTTIFSTLSVVIPVYLRNQNDLLFLKRSLDSIYLQTLFPCEVIISNDSSPSFDGELKQLISNYHKLKITFVRNSSERGISKNSNNGMRLAKSNFIHVLHQDDWLIEPNFYQELELSLTSSVRSFFLLPWRQLQVFYTPQFDLTALVGNNRVGGPSGVIFPNEPYHSFDEELSMLCDVDFVYRLFKRFGKPQIFGKPVIEYGVSDVQAQNQITSSEFSNELRKLFAKHKLSSGRILFVALTRFQPEVSYGIAKHLGSLPTRFFTRVSISVAMLYCRLLIRFRNGIT
jgi:glycosyltransferase involved in cell wall biosynthesis